MILAIKACEYQHDIRMPQEGGFECDRHLRAHVDALTLVWELTLASSTIFDSVFAFPRSLS